MQNLLVEIAIFRHQCKAYQVVLYIVDFQIINLSTLFMQHHFFGYTFFYIFIYTCLKVDRKAFISSCTFKVILRFSLVRKN